MIFTTQEIEATAFRHGSQGIQFYPPSRWGRVRLPEHAMRSYELAYVRGMIASYKGDIAPRCPKCGYTIVDAAELMDHHLCDGKIPTDYDAVLAAAHAPKGQTAHGC